jgi:hypothetical protein
MVIKSGQVQTRSMPDNDACGGSPAESFQVCFTGDQKRRRGSDVDYCPTGYVDHGDFIDGVGRSSSGGPDDIGGDCGSYDNGPCFIG